MKLHDDFNSSLLKGFEVQGVRGNVIRQCGQGGGKCALNSNAHSLYSSEPTRLWSLSSEVFPDKNLSRCHSNTQSYFINIISFTADFEEEVLKTFFKGIQPPLEKAGGVITPFNVELHLKANWERMECQEEIFKCLSPSHHLNWTQTESSLQLFLIANCEVKL